MVPSATKASYEDAHLTLKDDVLIIQSYYFPFANPKKIPIKDIKHTTRHPMDGIFSGRGRIWGSGNFKNWFNCDTQRSSKEFLFVHDIGSYCCPTTTPEDPKAFMQALIDAGIETSESDTTIWC